MFEDIAYEFNWLGVYKQSEIPQTLSDYAIEMLDDWYTNNIFASTIKFNFTSTDYVMLALLHGNKLHETVESYVWIPYFEKGDKAAFVFIED